MEKKISRRDLLKGAAAGAAGIAALGLLGACGTPDTPGSNPGSAPGSAGNPGSTPVTPPAGTYTPGTYSATATGMGTITVTMTFSADAITDVKLDLSSETPSIGQAAEDKLKEAILAAQSGEFDAVAGATITSGAVQKAARKCIQQAKGEIPIEVVTKDPGSAAQVPEGVPAWLGVEPEIAESEIKATYETEILVVGCGTGGMFTVCSAAEEGAKVIGIDRFAVGTGLRDDLGGVNSRYQKAWGTKIDKWEYVTMATQAATGHINQDLVKLFYEESGAVIDWYGDRLAERGVELWHEPGDSVDESRYKHFPTGHSPRWTGSDDGTGKMLDGNKVLYDYAIKQGAEFHYNTRMVKLVKENGRVTGVIATNDKDEYVRYTASKGVVVCTGGYAMNYEMMESLQGWKLRICGKNESMPGAVGDGIKACLWAGAKMDETHSMMMFDRCALRPDQEPGVAAMKAKDNGLYWIGTYPWLKVNKDGKRYFNESGTYEGILHADEYQKGHCHYTLFDSNWKKYAEEAKMHGCSRIFPFENGADPTIDRMAFEMGILPGLLEAGFLFKTDTIEELAEKLGLPPKQLAATVKRYNELCYKGEDEDYGKEPFRLRPMDTPPYYGGKECGTLLCTMDGIQIDTTMNAIDTEGEPIPGLYVVGNDSGGYFANTYPNLSTGMACGRTVTFGRLVGKHLAAL